LEGGSFRARSTLEGGLFLARSTLARSTLKSGQWSTCCSFNVGGDEAQLFPFQFFGQGDGEVGLVDKR
jgi:hypothetical protein